MVALAIELGGAEDTDYFGAVSNYGTSVIRSALDRHPELLSDELEECDRILALESELTRARDALCIAKGALYDMVGRAPEFEPGVEDYDDTQAAYNHGEDRATWTGGVMAGAALKKIRLIEEPTPTEGVDDAPSGEDAPVTSIERERIR